MPLTNIRCHLIICLFVLLLYVPSQQLWSWQDGQFNSPHFFLGKLEQTVNQYFVHILSLVTDNNPSLGAQWLSGRVLDSRPKASGFKPHRRHCVVSLSKNINPSLVLVQPRKTRPSITERLLMGRNKSIKQKTTLLE